MMGRQWASFCLLLAAGALSACQTPNGAPTQSSSGAASSAEQGIKSASAAAVPLLSGMPELPDCPDDLTGVLANGVRVHFEGASPLDSRVCIQRWLDRTHPYYLGFWGHGRFRSGSDEQRQAVAHVLTAPVGSRETFFLGKHMPEKLFRAAILEHVANERLPVGKHLRRAVKIRVTLMDKVVHPRIRSETVYWLDRATGIPLRKDVITRTADGDRWDKTIWRVTRIEGPPTDRSSPDT